MRTMIVSLAFILMASLALAKQAAPQPAPQSSAKPTKTFTSAADPAQSSCSVVQVASCFSPFGIRVSKAIAVSREGRSSIKRALRTTLAK